MSDLGNNFPIGVFFYSIQGTLGNWYAVWRMERIQDDNHSDFIEMCANATKSAPDYLSHCQTNDDLGTISRALVSSKRLSKSIISAVM